MKILMADLSSTPAEFAYEWPDSWVARIIDSLAGYSQFSSCKVQLEAYLVEETIVCRGEFKCSSLVECARCLEPVKVDLGGLLDIVLEPRKSAYSYEEDDDELDLGVDYYDGPEIDMEPIISEQLALNIPMRVLCDQECKGLCSSCGANLNNESCDCLK